MSKTYTDIPYEQRFTEALEFILKRRPPAELVRDWLNPDSDGCALQNWVGEEETLHWVQNIAILDAARMMADQPCEGEV